MEGSGFLGCRLIQVHLTRKCNLSCVHCYSDSGPESKGELALPTLMRRLRALRSEGYDVVSLSGGEPLLYSRLQELLRHSTELGFRVNVVTNGTVLTKRRIALLREYVSATAVSLDGLKERHDKMRDHTGAFARALRGCDELDAAEVPFGIVHCFTRDTIPDIPDLCGLATEHGARLVQLHPVAATGRATNLASAVGLSGADLARVLVLAQFLRVQYEGRLTIQVDVAPAAQLAAQANQYGILDSDFEPTSKLPLSDLVNPIVIDERGDLWPLAYGMARSQCIAHGSDDDWDAPVSLYKKSGCEPLRRLLNSAVREIRDDEVVDWYAHVVKISHRMQDGLSESQAWS